MVGMWVAISFAWGFLLSLHHGKRKIGGVKSVRSDFFPFFFFHFFSCFFFLQTKMDETSRKRCATFITRTLPVR